MLVGMASTGADLRGSTAHRDFWDSFYKSPRSDAVPESASPFAKWVHDVMPVEASVVEFGFGNARDSLWFARNGRRVHGFDFAQSAVERARSAASAGELPATFSTLDLYDPVATLTAVDHDSHVYGRFLIHSLEDSGRHNFLDAATGAAGLYLEFRTGHDAVAHHAFGEDHFRKYLDPDVVVEEIVERGGRVQHLEAGHGLAVYKNEDPHVARIVATWPAR